MPFFDLNHTPAATLADHLNRHTTLVACLCAAWCDVCKLYQPKFEQLAGEFPDAVFLWIDIEDQSALVGDLDIDNFPTLLIQQQDIVTFFGTMQPETSQLKRVIESQTLQPTGQAQSAWQLDANLRQRLAGS